MNKISNFNTQIIRESEETIKENTHEIERDLSATLDLLELMEFSIPLELRDSYNNLYLNVEEYHNEISDINKIDLEFLVEPVDTKLVGIFKGENSEGFSFSVLYIS